MRKFSYLNTVILVLGSNVGDRLSHLKEACASLHNLLPLQFSTSPIFETEPWGVRQQWGYYNMAILAKTPYGPFQLLNILKRIERKFGRTSKGDYRPRTLDIDIALMGNLVLNATHLTIPHPRMHERRFVLEPIHHISSSTMHPIFKKNIADLLKECKDNGKIKLLQNLMS